MIDNQNSLNEDAMYEAMKAHYEATLACRTYFVSYSLYIGNYESTSHIKKFALPENRENCIEQAIEYFKELYPNARGWVISNEVDVEMIVPETKTIS